jgi:hypothetical protein
MIGSLYVGAMKSTVLTIACHAAHAAILGRGTIPKGVQFRDNEVWLMKWLLAVCEPE